MKIAVVGGGASGVLNAIFLKRMHLDNDVTIFESNEKLLKKMYATGNGKCNFANIGDLTNKYNNEDFVLPLFKEIKVEGILTFYDSIGVHYKVVNDLVYPLSESAETVVKMLLKELDNLHVNVRLNYQVKDYELKGDKVFIDNEAFDKVIFASGGKSYPQCGTDGNLFNVFKKHGYLLKEPSASLCPIKIKENVKRLDGVRHKVLVSLYHKDKFIHEERGELLYKKDGLSGMVIFNLTHYINLLDDKNNVSIHIDFVPDIKEKINPSQYDEYVSSKLADYLSFNKLDIHNTIYTYQEMYDYQFSQVTSGGVCLSNIDKNFQSKLEKNIYFIGETLDVDAICGGFNLMFAYVSALKMAIGE